MLAARTGVEMVTYQAKLGTLADKVRHDFAELATCGEVDALLAHLRPRRRHIRNRHIGRTEVRTRNVRPLLAVGGSVHISRASTTAASFIKWSGSSCS
jgi:hypothetical protein